MPARHQGMAKCVEAGRHAFTRTEADLLEQMNGNCAEVACDYIQTAHRRVRDMEPSGRNPLEAPSLDDYSQMLGEQAVSCTVLGENWRNRVYRVQFAGGRVAIAKQLLVATDEMLQRQYAQYTDLARLAIPNLKVPQVLAILPSKRTYLMEVAAGETIEALVGRGSQEELIGACTLAGTILAQMELSQTKRSCPLPVEALARDFATAPWRLSARQRQTLTSALEKLAPSQVNVGQIYYDFKPANTLVHQDVLYLIDPPDILREGIHLWDFGLFRSSMRRHLWRLMVRFPLRCRRRAAIRRAMEAFQQAYVATLDRDIPRSFGAIVWLLELQRTAVLMTMQQGKLAITGDRDGTGQSLGHPLANRVSLPLLNVEKQWLFRQLARELKRIPIKTLAPGEVVLWLSTAAASFWA